MLLQGLCRPDRLLVFCCKACAGRIVCQLFTSRPVPVDHLPAVCLPAHLCHAMPTAHIHFAPFCFAFPRPLFIAMCTRIVVQVARTALLAATTRACSGGPCTGVDFCFFLPAESIDPGPWSSVNYKVKVLSCIVYECAPGMYVIAPAFTECRTQVSEGKTY